jgi:hypothetical protein
MKQSLHLVVLVVLLGGCSRQPTLSFSTSEEKGQTALHFAAQRLNGLLGIRIWRADTKDLLWAANLNYYKEPRLIYGEIPRDFATFNGGKNSAQQAFPSDSKPALAFPSDTRLLVAIDLQYDTFMTASTTVRYFEIKTDRNSRISSVTPLESIAPDEFPQNLEEPNRSLQSLPRN